VDRNSPLAEQILALDKQHIWHPYSSINSDAPMFPVVSAEGPYIHLATGEKLLDGMSSWWSTLHGYNHPELNAALSEQAAKMSHVMFGGLTHEPAVSLAKSLVDLSPPTLEQVFLCDSGSVAVEVALKMALQYWRSQGQDRHKFLTIRNGYHGDTFGAMSVCDPETGMHSLFNGFLPKNIFAEAPQCSFDQTWESHHFDNFEQAFETNKTQLAAVILEPILQGTGGMRFYSPEYLRQVRALCDRHGVLLIADEIATGFGRTGKFFACEHAGISPDIMCVGKAMTAGYLTLAATLCSRHVSRTICEGEAGVFMHGPTFMGNPLACAVANKSLELLQKNDWQTQVKGLEQYLREGLAPCRNLDIVKDVRVLGAIGVIELKVAVDMNDIQPRFVKNGIWLRPFGKLIYTMPPYICSEEEIQFLCENIYQVIRDSY